MEARYTRRRGGGGGVHLKRALILPLTKIELCTAKNKLVLRTLLIFMQPFGHIFLGIISFGYQGILPDEPLTRSERIWLTSKGNNP